jgi:outer membrane protein TolC
MSRIFKIIVALICINFNLFPVLQQAEAKSLSYLEVLTKSIDNSYDLKMTDKDIDISIASLKEVKADSYPTLKTGFSSEYTNDLNDQGRISSVGGTFIPPNTQFQDMLSVGLNYNLFDFGVNRKKVGIAKKDIFQKKFERKQTLRELKMEIIELYTKSLLAYKEIKIKQSTLDVDLEIFNMNKRLYDAGTISKIDLANDAIKVAKLVNDLDNLKNQLSSALTDLSFYTREKYSVESAELLDFDESLFLPVSIQSPNGENQIYQLQAEQKGVVDVYPDFDFTKSEEYQIYQLEIEKKKAELDILKKQRLPQFGFYSNYILYGYERSNIGKAFNNLEQTNVSFGISSQLPIFDGFKNQAQRQKTQLQISRLEIERDKKLAELQNKHEKLQQTSIFYNKEISNQQDLLNKVNDKLDMIDKLDEQQLVNKTEVLTNKEELLSQKLELEKSITNKISNIKKLQILTEELN